MADETTPTEPVPGKKSGKSTMYVKVFAPFKMYFEGEAHSVSAVNATGPFDILPHHHKFLCMLVPGTLSVTTEEGQKTFKIPESLLHVEGDKVVVYVDV